MKRKLSLIAGLSLVSASVFSKVENVIPVSVTTIAGSGIPVSSKLYRCYLCLW